MEGIVLWGGGLDVALLMGLELLAHLDLLLVAVLGVHLCAQAPQILGLLGSVVALAGSSLSFPLFMIETATMQLGVAFHILVLRLWAEWLCQCRCC